MLCFIYFKHTFWKMNITAAKFAFSLWVYIIYIFRTRRHSIVYHRLYLTRISQSPILKSHKKKNGTSFRVLMSYMHHSIHKYELPRRKGPYCRWQHNTGLQWNKRNPTDACVTDRQCLNMFCLVFLINFSSDISSSEKVGDIFWPWHLLNPEAS